MSMMTQWFSLQPKRDDSAPQSHIYYRLTNWLMVAGIILLTVNSARIVYRSIYSENPFPDEILLTMDWQDFFRALAFSNIGGDKLGDWVHGSGIAGSGLGGAVFSIGGDLLYSRVIVSAFDAITAILIGVLFFRRWSIGLLPALFISCIIWSATITTPFALPYWHGFTLNLGEFPSALWIGLGMVCVARQPHLAALLWGVAAWHTRLMVLPVPLLLTVVSALTKLGPIRVKLRQLIVLLCTFLIPLLAWVLICSVLFGVLEATKWLIATMSLIGLGTGAYQTITMHPAALLASSSNPFSLSHLISRLHDPHLEWSTTFYSLGTKLKVTILSLGSIAITLFGLYKQRPADRRSFTTLASLALIVMVLAYTYWWFMLHPTMWMRHFTPALYIGLGLWIFWLLQISLRFAMFERSFFRWGAIAFAATFIVWQTYFSWGISTRIGDFPTQWRCPIEDFVLVNTVVMICDSN